MWKKNLKAAASLLTVLIVLSGCSGGAVTEKQEPAVEPVQLIDVSEEPDAESPDGVPGPEPEDSGSESGVELIRLAESRKWFWEYIESGTAQVAVPYLFLAEEEHAYPGLRAILKKTSDERAAAAQQLFGEMQEEIKQTPNLSLNSETKTFINRADSRYLSLLLVEDSYLGGAHPSRTFICMNIRSGDGTALNLSDLSSNPEAVLFRMGRNLEDRYRDVLFGGVNGELTREQQEGTLIWTIGYDGITFYFPGGLLAPYSEGDLTAFLSWRDNSDILFPEDFAAPKAWAAAFCPDLPVYADPDGSGNAGVLQAGGTVYDAEADSFEGVYVSFDGPGVSTEEYCFTIRPYRVHAGDGTEWVYLETSSPNDFRNTVVFRIGGGTEPVCCGSSWSSLQKVDGPEEAYSYGRLLTFDPESFVLYTDLDALSTYSGVKTYHIGADGMPEPEDALYRIEHGPILTALKELPAKDETGADTSLAPGTELKLVETDGSSVVIAETAEGRRILTGSFDRWPQMVGDMDAEECLDGMFFAG